MLTKVTCVVVSVIICGALCQRTPFRKCSGDLPVPLSVQIEDCEALPCVLTRGTVASVDVQFVAVKDDSYNLEARVRATVLGIVIPYPLPNDSANVCNNLLYGAYCPLYADEDVTYHIDFPLDSNVPDVGVKCEISVVDEDKGVVACFIADLKISKVKNVGTQNLSD